MRPYAAHGISLVETLVTLVLLSIGTLTVFALLVQSIAGRTQDRQHLRAVHLLEDLGELVNCNPADPAAAAFDEWRQRVATELSHGDAVLEFAGPNPAAPGSTAAARARLTWINPGGRAASLEATLPVATRP